MWAPGLAAPLRCNVCCALDAAKHREVVVDTYENRCDPMIVRRDIFLVCPWMAELRRAPPTEMRSDLQRVRKHLAPANASGLEDVLGQDTDVPSDGTSFLLTFAHFSGSGTQAGKDAAEPVDRTRLSRALHMKCKYLLPNGVQPIDRPLEYSRRVAKRTDSALACAVASEREFIWEAMRISHAPFVPTSKGLALPVICLEGLSNTWGALRTLSRMVKDAARVETPFLTDICSTLLTDINADAGVRRLLRIFVEIQYAGPEGEDVVGHLAKVPAAQAPKYQ